MDSSFLRYSEGFCYVLLLVTWFCLVLLPVREKEGLAPPSREGQGSRAARSFQKDPPPEADSGHLQGML